MNYKRLAVLKLFLLIIALGLAMFLAFGQGSKELSSDHTVVFVLDINRSMNTKDVLSGTQQISRIDAAKSIIKTTIFSEPRFSYGLIIFNNSADYIIPPTFDTGTFLLYLDGITTNLLPDGAKNFASLSGILTEKNTSYLILSDFDASVSDVRFHRGISLIGLGSLEGDIVRYANGTRYFDNGASVTSARNDSIAKSFGTTYIPLSDISTFHAHRELYRGFALPLSQLIFLYTLLGVFVIFAIML